MAVVIHKIMKDKKQKDTIIKCSDCGHKNIFPQPHPYHAGFGNQGFLYNEAGTMTFVWSSFDPAYEAVVGNKHPWTLNKNERIKIEALLKPAPTGGKWKFSNPARCINCGKQIGEPMISTIYYLFYEGSVNADYHDNKKAAFKDYIKT